ncbi:hypothetical protein RchiOBHm_Chr5g0034801 [Rosa chinensis]|uniref:Uncharacterized protein n=1 Tax=Rosa chinensis TaxID=74649 RepID=A0A2P6QB18_ROSCH|nr:hypothetical protein RchiOBHm_Chr5g0034801 [Rosa chinensis]
MIGHGCITRDENSTINSSHSLLQNHHFFIQNSVHYLSSLLSKTLSKYSEKASCREEL